MPQMQIVVEAAVAPIREQLKQLEGALKETGPERQRAAEAKASQLRLEAGLKTIRFVLGMLLLLALLSDHGDTLRHIFRPPPVDIAARVDTLVGDAIPERRSANAVHLDECAASLRAAAAYVKNRATQSAGSTPLTTELRKDVDRQCQSLLVR